MAKEKKVKITVPQNIMGGVYSNLARIHHAREEFMLDFIIIGPEEGIVNSRVFISPGHVKRMIKALQINVNKYEKKFGKIKEAEPPQGVIDTKIKPA